MVFPMKIAYWRCGALSLFAVVTALALLQTSWAQTTAHQGDAYVVRAVAVDVTAETAADARQIAIRRGQMEALQTLLRRMTLDEDRGRLPRPDSRTVESLVRTIEFENERYSSTRYIADLTVGFDGAGVRRALQLARIPFAEPVSNTVLVLPIYEDAGAHMLWDRPNPWWDAWQQMDWRTSLLPFALPEGTLADLASLSADQAMRGNQERLGQLGSRYGTTEVVVAPASWSTDLRTGEPTLVVDIRHYGVAGEQVTPFEVPLRGDESEADFLVRVAGEVGSMLADEWKKNALVQQGAEGTLTATLDVTSLQDVVTARNRFDAAPMIRSINLESLSTTRAVYQLTYLGGQEQLSVSLSQYGIDLIETEDGWRLGLQR